MSIPPMPRFSESDDLLWEICGPCKDGAHQNCIEKAPSLYRPPRCECACVEDRLVGKEASDA